ncbi:hypothetical protein EDB19DRAFT_1834044 [Suillus lakei]|nr:hypothetical protein EDB19DRAFT_1834044 [Suillus lakei]
MDTVDLTRSSTNSLDSDDNEAMAGAFDPDPDPDPAADLALGGVHRYQDTKDKSSTTNLKHHAIGCFGEDAVNNPMKGKDAGANSGSIYAAFACQGQQSITPIGHIQIQKFGKCFECCPNIKLPPPDVLSCNIKVAFEKCSERIGQLLRSHTGAAMAKAFQAMLERFGLTKRILAVNADNATANDAQTTKLLSAKALLKPFSSDS